MVFLSLGVVSPYIDEEFGSNIGTDADTDIQGDANTGGIFGSLSASAVMLVNIFTMPFWTFGLNAWINLIVMLPLRVMFWFLGIRILRGVG